MTDLDQEYDIVVAGGGITGAGVFHEAARLGLKPLLVEARDFAWGTSSRSSKMIHGGLRYLKQGKFRMTRDAVRQRESLLLDYPGLVSPIPFIMPLFDHYGPSPLSMKTGLCIYSWLAGKKQHRQYSASEALAEVPGLRKQNLLSAVGFKDAQVEDARLVLRLIFDACRMGGSALNYTRVTGIERDRQGRLASVRIKDEANQMEREIKTRTLINATGALAETLHPLPLKEFHMRPLRGSHLFFPSGRTVLDRVISFIHPADLRPVFLFPWEGVWVLGTTDVDHDADLAAEPRISRQEAHYLLEGVAHVLPGLNLSPASCISSMAGIRPVISRGEKKDASKESREHMVWQDRGLVTVTGGKLTTFRLLARDAIKAAQPFLSSLPSKPPAKAKPVHPLPHPARTDQAIAGRIMARYGPLAASSILSQEDPLLLPIGGTPYIWAQIRHAAEHESIAHLEDIMLRRVRIGLLLPDGGMSLLDRVEDICRPFLSWDDERWQKEKKDYANLWQTCYAPPDTAKKDLKT